MTKRNINKPFFLLSFFLTTVFAGSLRGQTYKIGDVYTFSDGTKGVVFELDPEHPGCGTVAALNDLSQPYAMLPTGNIPSNVLAAQTNAYTNLTTTSWTKVAPTITQLLHESGNSPAAEAADVANGWYIPDILQLRKIYSLIPLLHEVFDNSGGDVLVMLRRGYWSATNETTRFYAMESNGGTLPKDVRNEYYVRPVRNFGYDTARAFWANSHQKADTVVSPASTSTYDAHVIYKADTVVLTSTVTVHPNHNGDTIRETVFVTPTPYTSQANPLFTQLDISEPGEFLFRKPLQSIHGCDSAITLILTVQDHTFHTETWCSLTEEQYYAPLDTVFLPGTISGRYEHHGSKEVDGVSVDTTAYFDLTILPIYEIYDTLSHCLYQSEESLAYEPNEWVNITVLDGVVSVVSTSEDVVVEVVSANQDYIIRMQSVHACDSLLYLHLNLHEVVRDTILYELPITNVIDNQIVAACIIFTDITESGTYVLSDTLVDAVGCDSIVTVVLTVKPCELDFAITCPPDIYDTLAYGDCVMAIYPERLGTPNVIYEEEWPFRVSNNLPEEMLFAEGENIVTWTVTDLICGISKECRQRVFIAFPQCPEAVDCEGNIYQSVRIGCDCWTQRNLESTKYSDCTDIPDVYEYSSWKHPDTMANVATYGRHYTFEAAVRDSSDNGYGHIQGICPDGWYLPTPDKYAGLNAYGAEALKSPHYWIDGGGHNSTGFSALPAGFFNGEKNRFEGLLTETYFWSTQLVGGAVGESLFLLRHHCDEVLESLTYNGLGYSIRCIKER